MVDLNFIGITGLALADSVNPCAIAILVLVLMFSIAICFDIWGRGEYLQYIQVI